MLSILQKTDHFLQQKAAYFWQLQQKKLIFASR